MINHKLFRDIILVLAVLFILSSFVSCGGDDIAEDKNVLPPPDTAVPTVVNSNSTIKAGDEAVDPSVINKSGSIKVHFNERVTGKISLERSKDGLDLCWSSEVDSPGTNLMLVYNDNNDDCPNTLLDYGTAYVIHGKVSDTAGNEIEVRIPFTTKVGPPIITIVFKADDFNHFNPDIWSYQLHTDGLLKKNVFVAVAYIAVFDGGALDHWDGWGPGWNKWRVEGNTITRNDLVFIPKHATFSKILPSPFPFRREERKHINYFSIEILPYVRGWGKYFWNNPFKMIGVSGDGPLFIDVGQITPTYAVGNPSKAELLR